PEGFFFGTLLFQGAATLGCLSGFWVDGAQIVGQRLYLIISADQGGHDSYIRIFARFRLTEKLQEIADSLPITFTKQANHAAIAIGGMADHALVTEHQLP